MLARLVSLMIFAAAVPAYAQHVEYVGKVTASPAASSPMRPIGARYIALTGLRFDDDVSAHVDVLDLDTKQVVHVTTPRATMLRHFSYKHPKYGKQVPDGELVSYDGKHAGLYLADDVLSTPTRRHWYVELDGSGKLVRRTLLATLDRTAELHFIGTDAPHGTAWFYIDHYAAPRQAKGAHLAGPKDIVLRKLDLRTLVMTDAITIPLAARPMRHGYEDLLDVRYAPDFSKLAVVEYDEAAFQTKPYAKIYVVDPVAATSFSVPALDTTYGVTFSRDGKYLYLASSQRGTVARVDLAAQRIDKQVAGPMLTHEAVISPNGKQLFVVGSSTTFTVYDLPGLTNRTVVPHVPQIASNAAGLAGGGVGSLDGRYYVLPDADGGDAHTQKLVVTRLVD